MAGRDFDNFFEYLEAVEQPLELPSDQGLIYDGVAANQRIHGGSLGFR